MADIMEYKGKKIEFEESSEPSLSLNGKPVEVSYDMEAETFNSWEFPYQTFQSVKELAEALVDQQEQEESR